MQPDSNPPYSDRERRSQQPKQFNLNSVLLTIVLGISAWSLSEQVKQGRDFSKMEERLSNQTVAVTELRLRLTAVETEITGLQIKLAEGRRSNN